MNYTPQTYIVSGGYYISSTELLVETGSAWVLTAELPSPRNGPSLANVDSRILMTGN